VDVDDFDFTAVRMDDGELFVTLVGVTDFAGDFPAGDDAVGEVNPVVAQAVVEGIGDLAHLLRIDLLK
jgi:hypothetical protein